MRNPRHDTLRLHGAYTQPILDPDLAKLVEVWPTLPANIRNAILALVNAAK